MVRRAHSKSGNTARGRDQMTTRIAALFLALEVTMSTLSAAPPPAIAKRIDDAASRIDAKVIAWRRDIHEHPELGNREVRTAKIVADHLRSLGVEVQEKVAHTGVVGILRGGKPGKVAALRADMDA